MSSEQNDWFQKTFNVGKDFFDRAEQEVETVATEAFQAGKAVVQKAEASVGLGNKRPASDDPKPQVTAKSSGAALPLSGSVGRGGQNRFEDVKAVQVALNRRMRSGLDEDGKSGNKTVKAIEAFQRTLGQSKPDGLVEPGRATARALGGAGGSGGSGGKPTGKLAYEPGEREASLKSPGSVEKTPSGFVLFDFPVNKQFLKPGHQRFLADLVAKLKLDDAGTETAVAVLSGFTDGVDEESKNAPLRHDRADSVQNFLLIQGAAEENVGVIVETPAGKFLAANSTREGRARNRAVTIAFASLTIPSIPDPPKPTKPSAIKTSLNWSLASDVSAGPPIKLGGASVNTFRLVDLDNGEKHVISFTGAGPGLGAGLPISVSVPSPTNFVTTKGPVDVSAFNGFGQIIQAGAAAVIGFSEGVANLVPDTDPPLIDISGFQVAFGASVSAIGGLWKVIV